MADRSGEHDWLSLSTSLDPELEALLLDFELGEFRPTHQVDQLLDLFKVQNLPGLS